MKTLMVILLFVPALSISQTHTIDIFRTDVMRDSTGKVFNLVVYVKDSTTGAVFACAFRGDELEYSKPRLIDSLKARARRVFRPILEIKPKPLPRDLTSTDTDTTKQRLVIQ